MTETAEAALPIDSHGKLYQQRALQALPLLVRQARAGNTIFYADLAAEMGMPNPRNLNFVLGSVATSLVHLGDKWGASVPPLQAIVVNQSDEMPGPGFVHSLVDPKLLANVSSKTRRQVVDGMLAEVFTYSKWEDVLAHFGAKAAAPPVTSELLARAGKRYGAGESPEHARFKAFVAANPGCIGISGRVVNTATEFCLPSGDRIDVLFTTRKGWAAAEVKSTKSDESDLVRGVFQCVKYAALLNALAASTGSVMDVSVCLAIEGPSTPSVSQLGNTLGVVIVDNVKSCIVEGPSAGTS